MIAAPGLGEKETERNYRLKGLEGRAKNKVPAMPDPQIYCFPAKRMGFPVVSARGISFLRDLEEQDTDGKLSAVTLQEHACSCSSSFLELIL